MSAEISLTLYTGTSDTRGSDLRIADPGHRSDARFGGVNWAPRPFEDSPYYGVRLSHFREEVSRLGVSLDFTHYKIHARTRRPVWVSGVWNGVPANQRAPLEERVQAFEVSHGVNLIAINGHYRWSYWRNGAFPQGRLQPYVATGPGFYLPHSEGIVGGRPVSGDYQYGGFAFQVLAGLRYRLGLRWSALVELKYDRGDLDMDLRGGIRVRTDLDTFHFAAGVSLDFP